MSLISETLNAVYNVVLPSRFRIDMSHLIDNEKQYSLHKIPTSPRDSSPSRTSRDSISSADSSSPSSSPSSSSFSCDKSDTNVPKAKDSIIVPKSTNTEAQTGDNQLHQQKQDIQQHDQKKSAISRLTKSINKTSSNNNHKTATTKSNITIGYCEAEFTHLRSLVIENETAELDFKQCLWSCEPWSAPGGKSGSTFFKTTNDQFILKQMTKVELRSFLAVSTKYFSYIEECFKQKKPTLLSTILGIYKLTYYDSVKNTKVKCDFMVTQNLFYKRNVIRIFDLKGSTRNRLVNIDSASENQSELVLMDENLRQITGNQPLLVSQSSKTNLSTAIESDSTFLSTISVMDYSLLVGIDAENSELVVAIIDYMRPFTWDKKLEQVVKSVGSAEMPTIVEPKLYKTRFCDAMDKYFQGVM